MKQFYATNDAINIFRYSVYIWNINLSSIFQAVFDGYILNISGIQIVAYLFHYQQAKPIIALIFRIYGR